MKQSPFLSVIIPCFRSENTLPHLLESLSKQSFLNFEVIIMDGASDDGTISTAEKWSKSIPSLIIRSEKDEGIYDAINKGIGIAKADWIYIIGSDDQIFSNEVFSSFHSYALKSNEKLLYGDVQVVGDAGWAKDGQIYNGHFERADIVKQNICQQAIFYHRSLFSRYGLFEKRYKTCADWDFLFRVIANENCAYIPLTVALFYGGGTSVNRQDAVFQEELPLNLYNYFGRALRSPDFYSLRYRFYDLAGVFHSKGKRWNAFRCSRIFKYLNDLPEKGK